MEKFYIGYIKKCDNYSESKCVYGRKYMIYEFDNIENAVKWIYYPADILIGSEKYTKVILSEEEVKRRLGTPIHNATRMFDEISEAQILIPDVTTCRKILSNFDVDEIINEFDDMLEDFWEGNNLKVLELMSLDQLLAEDDVVTEMFYHFTTGERLGCRKV